MNSHSLFAHLLSWSLIGPSLAGTVTIDPTPPTVDAADIAQLTGASDAGGDQGHLWSNRPHQGQSFTTGPDPSGYFLTSVTLQNLNNTIGTAPTFNIQVGTLTDTGSPETFTQVGTTETGVSPNYAPLDYITFTFDSPVQLDPNTRYAFLWGTSSQGFVTVNNLDDNSYADGTALSSGDNNVLDPANVILQNVDRVFHLNLEVVDSFDQDLDGLPSQWEIDNGLDPDDNGENPNNNGVPGDPINGPNGDPDMDGLNNLGELNRVSDSQGFVTVNNLDDNSYADGTALSSGDNNVLDPANVILQNVDRVFHLNLEVVDSFDQDLDGLPSQWEIDNGLDPDDNGENPNNNGVPGDPINGPNGDPDMDGLNNLGELNRVSDPQDSDTDDDTLSDKVETKTGIFVDANDTGSDPALSDTDGDMIDDNDEIAANPHVTDPNKADTDGDGISDFDELQADPYVTDPTQTDTDNDGFHDGLELSGGGDPTDPSSLPVLDPMYVSILPPTINGEDIAQLGGTADIGGDLGHAWSDRPRQGQSFTTGSNPGGYTLSAITVRARVAQPSTISPNWELRVGSLDETGIFTPLVTETIIGVTIPNGNDNWVTWTLATPLDIAPNTTYGYDIYPDDRGYISLGEAADVLPDGSAFSSGSPGSTVYPASPPDPVTSHGNDRAFHIDLEASNGGGLAFTEIVIIDTPGGEAVRLTWNSSSGRTYALDASTDLVDWSAEVDDGILADSETTTIERLIADLPVTGPRVFFRIRQE